VSDEDAFALPPRWHPARLSPPQLGYVRSTARVNLVIAGRRSFKTEGAKRRLIRAAIGFTEFSDGRFYATAPTHRQSKDIFWTDLKAMVPDWAIQGGRRRGISDSELTISLVNGAKIKVAGLDKPERIEGKDWDGGVISEFGNCKANVFSEVIRPMMTRGGWIDIEGVPEGRNHYYDLATRVLDGKLPGGVHHHWTTEDVLHLWLGEKRAAAEIAEAKESLDTLTYDQEYRARFISFEGLAYHAFSPANVAANGDRVVYQPDLPLILAFDFNREPGVCAYIQEIPANRIGWLKNPNISRQGCITSVIGEVFIRRRSNTKLVCERILADWADLHRGDVVLYGDPAGGAKGSSAIEGSDWDLIDAHLRPAFGRRLIDRVATSAPRIRVRLNSVNSRLEAADGRIGLVVDAKAAPHVIRDFEGVQADSQGSIIKTAGDPLTHISDGIGYYICEAHPLGGPVTTVRR